MSTPEEAAAIRLQINELRADNERLTVEAQKQRAYISEEFNRITGLEDEIERLKAQVSRDDEHYQAAMAMAEKHRKNWVEACQEREQLRALLFRHQVAACCEEDSDLAVETRAALEPKP